jgi:chaperonin GroEL (HSP60 family)
MNDETADAMNRAINQAAGNILQLKAECMALRAIVRMLAMNAGSDGKAVSDALEKLSAAGVQFQLEKIEEENPAMAALLDERGNWPEIELKLLRHLRFRS